MKKHPTIELLESLNTALIYALETATCLAVLYLLYHFMLRKEKSFQYNRFYLLVALVFSMSFPLMEFSFNPANTPSVLNSIHQVGNEVSNEPIIEADKAYSYTITATSERPFLPEAQPRRCDRLAPFTPHVARQIAGEPLAS